MQAAWLVGGERHLAFFPEFRGERLVLGSGLGATLDRVAAMIDSRDSRAERQWEAFREPLEEPTIALAQPPVGPAVLVTDIVFD